MSREIKFRAWDKRLGLNKMYWNVNYIPYGDGWSGGNPEYRFYQIYHGKGGFFLSSMDEIEIMQYTGCNDVNGKEIYEGDVVEYLREQDQYMQEARIYKVRVLVKWEGFGFNLFQPTSNYSRPVSGFEVLGNIYENTDLITNKKINTIL